MSLDSVWLTLRFHEISLSAFGKHPLWRLSAPFNWEEHHLRLMSSMSGMPCRDALHRKGGFCTTLITAAFSALHVVQI